jgi:serine/threonine-protein kinase HipA
MRKAIVYIHNIRAGILSENDAKNYTFSYDKEYLSHPVSLSMPTSQREYNFENFPPFFDGLLPEGIMLDGLLKINKLDKRDYFAQLLATGSDLVGAVTLKPENHE